VPSLEPSLELGGNGNTRQHAAGATYQLDGTVEDQPAVTELESLIHTIFEGTSEIQQLVISRAISGLRIE
jgi:alkylation response protein AidB-like acyl-CoA dehydrogenase